jgi:hypothetical protein
MKRVLLSAALVLLLTSVVSAQGYVAYLPVAPTPVVSYYAPPAAYAAPVFPAPAVQTSYYAPAEPVVQTSYFAPSPVVQTSYYTPYYAAAPVVAAPVGYYTARPVVAAPVAYTAGYAPAVVVRPKVYVYGEPVRNFFRAVTP